MKPKKNLGQHFLTDENIAFHIVESLNFQLTQKSIDCLEIGPGKGVLTKYLLKNKKYNFKAVEFDNDAVDFLLKNMPEIKDKIIHQDILKLDFRQFSAPMLIIGNLPYNITAPIFFEVLKNREKVHQMVAMIQKEVAQRIVSPPGSKVYGILSVLLQAFYKTEYLMTVEPDVFFPAPKVHSAVIRLTKLEKTQEIEDWKKFKNIVKAAFNQRRKTLRNALKLYDTSRISTEILQKRAEQLSVDQFVEIYNLL